MSERKISSDDLAYLKQVLRLINEANAIRIHYSSYLSGKYNFSPTETINEDGFIIQAEPPQM
jgi:hypothetical protein